MGMLPGNLPVLLETIHRRSAADKHIQEHQEARLSHTSLTTRASDASPHVHSILHHHRLALGQVQQTYSLQVPPTTPTSSSTVVHRRPPSSPVVHHSSVPRLRGGAKLLFRHNTIVAPSPSSSHPIAIVLAHHAESESHQGVPARLRHGAHDRPPAAAVSTNTSRPSKASVRPQPRIESGQRPFPHRAAAPSPAKHLPDAPRSQQPDRPQHALPRPRARQQRCHVPGRPGQPHGCQQARHAEPQPKVRPGAPRSARARRARGRGGRCRGPERRPPQGPQRGHQERRRRHVQPAHLRLAHLPRHPHTPHGRIPRPHPPRRLPGLRQDPQRHLPHPDHRPPLPPPRQRGLPHPPPQRHRLEAARRARSPAPQGPTPDARQHRLLLLGHHPDDPPLHLPLPAPVVGPAAAAAAAARPHILPGRQAPRPRPDPDDRGLLDRPGPGLRAGHLRAGHERAGGALSLRRALRGRGLCRLAHPPDARVPGLHPRRHGRRPQGPRPRRPRPRHRRLAPQRPPPRQGPHRRALRLPERPHPLRLHPAPARGPAPLGLSVRLRPAPQHSVHRRPAHGHARSAAQLAESQPVAEGLPVAAGGQGH